METRLNEIKDSDKYIHTNECKNLKQKIKQLYKNKLKQLKYVLELKILKKAKS